MYLLLIIIYAAQSIASVSVNTETESQCRVAGEQLKTLAVKVNKEVIYACVPVEKK